MAQKQTILFYINSLGHGGAERVVLQLASQFGDAGYRPVIITSFVLENEYPLPEGVIRRSIEQEQIIQSRFKRNFSRIKALRRICKEEQAPLLISFLCEPNFRALLATVGLPIKTIVSVRGDPTMEYAGTLGWLISKILMPLADGCVFQTEKAKAWFPARLQKKSAVISNPLAEKFFQCTYSPDNHVITLGRLIPDYNHKLLIAAFLKIAKNHPESNLLIFGEGPLQAELENYILALNAQDRVKLMGRTDDSRSVLQNAAVFALTANHGGLPNALMEALAVGVPSICTDFPSGGPASLIEHGHNGLLVPVENVDALAIALGKLLSDKNYAQKLGMRAKQNALSFRPDQIFSHWENYVKQICPGL